MTEICIELGGLLYSLVGVFWALLRFLLLQKEHEAKIEPEPDHFRVTPIKR